METRSFSGKDLEMLVPHRGPAILIRSVTHDVGNPDVLAAEFLPTEREFAGHFGPENPVLPGHWLLEAMAVTCTALATIRELGGEGVIARPLLRECAMKSSAIVRPGDLVRIIVSISETKKLRGNGAKITFAASAEFFESGNRIAEGAITGVI